jgi:uncharacterized protein (TIGR03086 family)
MESLQALEVAFANTGRLIAGVRADQWEVGTPCEKWDVRQLVDHVTSVVQRFGAAAANESAPPRDADGLGGDPAARFLASAAVTLAAWRARDSADGEVILPLGPVPASYAIRINLVDACVHGWDIAIATGQDPALDAEACELALAVSEQLLPTVGRRDRFAEAVSVSADAPAADRLVAYLGRRP